MDENRKLDELRDRLYWMRAELVQKQDWIRQDKAARDPYNFRAERLLHEAGALLDAVGELNDVMYRFHRGA